MALKITFGQRLGTTTTDPAKHDPIAKGDVARSEIHAVTGTSQQSSAARANEDLVSIRTSGENVLVIIGSNPTATFNPDGESAGWLIEDGERLDLSISEGQKVAFINTTAETA